MSGNNSTPGGSGRNNGYQPLEQEYRSSQLYRALHESGVPAASKVAEGIGKAAEGIDNALQSVLGTDGKRPGSENAQQTPGERYVPGGDEYAYHYVYSKPDPAGQQNAPPRRTPNVQTYTQKTAQSPHATPSGANRRTNGPAPTGQNQTGGRPPVGGPPAGYGRAPSQGRQAQPRPARAEQPKQAMKAVYRGSPAKYYITGGTALFYAMFLPLYEPAHFIIFGLVLAGVFLLSSKLFRGKKEYVPAEAEPQEEPKKPEPASRTGNPEVDKIIEEGSEYLRRLRAANDAIPEETLSEDIDRMEKASADIFRYIAKHPEKAPQIRKFMSYYLPTTLKLLNSYQNLSAQSVKGENITSTMFNIAGMMHTVADAFEKQLDSLFSEEAMDVSADISVFETLLKQEGFLAEGHESAASRPGQKTENTPL